MCICMCVLGVLKCMCVKIYIYDVRECRCAYVFIPLFITHLVLIDEVCGSGTGRR